MTNYSHKQFSPEFNRLGRGAPAQMKPNPKRVEQRDVDPNNPYAPIHAGGYSECFVDGNGNKHEYFFYVPDTFRTVGNVVFVLTAKGFTAKEFFEKNSWKSLLEKNATDGCFIAPNGDWNKNDPGEEIDSIRLVMNNALDLQYFAGGGDAIYFMGFGSGAYIASVYAALYSSSLAAVAAAGEFEADEKLFRIIGSLPTDGDASTRKSEYPMPAWIIDSNGSGKVAADYFKKACNVAEENLNNDDAEVWREKTNQPVMTVNSQACTEVWYSGRQKYDELSSDMDSLIEKMLKFVSSFRHWGGFGNGHYRKSKSQEEMGLKRLDVTIGGLKRHWYVYEPSAYRKGLKKSFPLVVAIHGYTCSGLFFAENSDWVNVAEERGFFVVFPTGYPFNLKNAPIMRSVAPHPAWNSFGGGDPEGPDDIKFIQYIVDKTKKDYPIDGTRVYATGHSNGSAMTQMLMRQIPEVFAAFGPIGAMECSFSRDAIPEPNDIPRPVWYMMGQFDVGDQDSLDENKSNYKTLKNLCSCNKADLSHCSKYVNGIYKNLICYDAQHVPMVRFTGVNGWPHTVTPESSLILWDEFFCKFVRNSDGTVTYLG